MVSESLNFDFILIARFHFIIAHVFHKIKLTELNRWASTVLANRSTESAQIFKSFWMFPITQIHEIIWLHRKHSLYIKYNWSKIFPSAFSRYFKLSLPGPISFIRHSVIFIISTRVEPCGKRLGVVLEENRGVRVVKISKTRCDILAPDVWYELITSRIHPILNLWY